MPKPGSGPAADDYGSSVSSFGLYSLGGALGGVIEEIGDRDWFQINVDPSQVGSTITIELSAASGKPNQRLDVFAALLDSEGMSLPSGAFGAAPDSANNRFTITWSPVASGKYFLDVGASSAAATDAQKTGSYSIASTVVPGEGPPPEPPATTYQVGLAAGQASSQLEAGAAFNLVVTREGDVSSAEALSLDFIAETSGLDADDFGNSFPLVIDFSAGASQVEVAINIKNDSLSEADESFRLALKKGGQEVASSDVLTIQNDDIAAADPSNDAAQYRAWGQHNTGQAIGYYSDGSAAQGSPDADTDWLEAYQRTNGGGVIKVGVIDSGARIGHEDLGPIKGYDFIRNDSTPNDENGHGTHVQGTIAAMDNAVGVVGYNPKADVYTYKAGDRRGSLPGSAILAALDRGVQDGIKIYNCSYGSYSYSSTFYNAYKTVQDSGALIFAAAGNGAKDSSINPHYPSAYDLPGIVSVAATDFNDRLATFSDYGDKVDLAAPGVNIYSTTYDGGYGFKSGTSMASPAAAGAASMLWAQNPNLTAAQVKQLLMQSVDPISGLRVFSSGRLNINNALDLAAASGLAGFESFASGAGGLSSGAGVATLSAGPVARGGGTVVSAPSRLDPDEIIGDGVILAALNPGRLNALSRIRAKVRKGVGPFAAIDRIDVYKNLSGIVAFKVDGSLSVTKQAALASSLQGSSLVKTAELDFNHFLI